MKTELLKKLSAAAIAATMFFACTGFTSDAALKNSANTTTAISVIDNDEGPCPIRGTYYGEWEYSLEVSYGGYDVEYRTRTVNVYCKVCGRCIYSYEERQCRVLIFDIIPTPWF